MRVKFDSKGGFDNTLKWMAKAKNIPYGEIRQLADQGTYNLIRATPEDTGETAHGWVHEVSTTPHGIEIAWKNIANPESEVNVAKLIELGHGTGTGGYVQPKPYIKQAMEPVWSKLDKDVGELIK